MAAAFALVAETAQTFTAALPIITSHVRPPFLLNDSSNNLTLLATSLQIHKELPPVLIFFFFAQRTIHLPIIY